MTSLVFLANFYVSLAGLLASKVLARLIIAKSADPIFCCSRISVLGLMSFIETANSHFFSNDLHPYNCMHRANAAAGSYSQILVYPGVDRHYRLDWWVESFGSENLFIRTRTRDELCCNSDETRGEYQTRSKLQVIVDEARLDCNENFGLLPAE